MMNAIKTDEKSLPVGNAGTTNNRPSNKRKERKLSTKQSTKSKPAHGKSDDEKLPQLSQWIENYEEAVTNHYSPELRARIGNIRLNGAHSELNGSVDPSINKCKVQTIPPGVKCLVASVSLPLGTPVVELREDLTDLEGLQGNLGGGGGITVVPTSSPNVVCGNGVQNEKRGAAEMSVCLESGSSVLPSQVGKLSETAKTGSSDAAVVADQQELSKNSVPKLIVSGSQENANPILQKVVNTPVITVVNTPITVVKTIGGSTASHFTLVNSAVKSPPTITLVNAPPITVVKTISDQGKTEVLTNTTNNGNLPVAAITEKPSAIHNVFVKKSTPAEGGAISMPDMPQSHKLLTANSFPTTNVIPNLNTGPILKTANGQRNLNTGSKVKILSNVVMSGNASSTGPGPSNVLLNKNQRYYQQKLVGNGATKYLNRPPDKRLFYPIHKSQLKTLSGYKPPPTSTIKTLSPGSVQRTGAGLRTIPPQRPQVPTKTNYIGKHAVQAQKMKPKVKTKATPLNNHMPRSHPPEQSAQMIFNQALTAQILETLSDKDSQTNKIGMNSYLNTKYEPKHEPVVKPEPREFKPQSLSTLDTLSFVCQAVLLDHNYNATLPTEPTPPPVVSAPPVNGTQQFSPVPNYPTGISTIKRNRTTSQTIIQREDDAASDISEERKLDTEGEETDTAPEAEAVSNEPNDRYGDYVTRCICGFIHDDGYMIECDKCKVWQHVRCVVKTKKVPDDYLCEECDPSKHTDRQKARALQQQWMRDIQERDAKLRKEQMALSDTDSSDGECHKNRRKEPPRRQRRDSLQNRTTNNRPSNKRKERKLPTKRSTKTKPAHGKSDDEKLPQLRQWIENYEEAVTNHYSPELRARIGNIRLNGAHSELNGSVDPSVNKCKVQTIPPGVKCLVASVSLPLGTPVVELRGKYMLSTQHRATTRQQRPGPFLFFHTLIKDTEVCVDTRTYGNCARFIRRSCTPNAELQHVLEKGAVHLYIVTTKSIDKGAELTIRHESHDIAAAHLTEIPCACTNPEYCALIKGHRRHNGDTAVEGRKRRGRQSRENFASPPLPAPTTPEIEKEEEPIKKEIEEEPVVMKQEIKEEVPEIKEEPVEIKENIIKPEEESKEVEDEKKIVIKEEPEDIKPEELEDTSVKEEPKKEVKEEEEEEPVQGPSQVTTRRASRHAQDPTQEMETSNTCDEGNKKLSREERKLQAIMKAIERMEKQEQRKQEHQAKQAHRRESEPSSACSNTDGNRFKRRKRKGRARTTSTNSRNSRNRLDSVDSMHSSDDTLLSPPSETSSPTKAAGLLLALANGEASRKSPERTMDSNSNSAHSSPETPLSSACLLVAAAVEPLEPGFKFPKTKKVLMNEWLNKADVVQSASAISPSSLTPHIDNNIYPPGKNLNALAQAASFCDQPRSGSAKKRWLRQAISEDQCDSPPQGTSEPAAPPKKRRLPRESLSTEGSPPTTPTLTVPPQVEIVTPQDDECPSQMESEATLNELASEMRQEYGNCIHLSRQENMSPSQNLQPIEPPRSIMDPRLTSRFSNSEQLVGTVEKTLSFLGFEEAKKPEAITPAKRKLSITEYRQRKKLNNNDKTPTDEISVAEESNSSQSPKLTRTRSNSSSSVTSGSTSDDETVPLTSVPEVKALSAFNSEPTELERQRESVSLRLKRALGLSVDDESKKTPLNVETILKGEIPLPTPTKCTIPLSSPSFPIPGSAEPTIVHEIASSIIQHDHPPSDDLHVSTVIVEEHVQDAAEPEIHNNNITIREEKSNNTLFYTPDDEEMAESTSYVPPFNNPLYPNTSYTTYGSVIDDDVPYEGRNPSPPPELHGNP